MRDKVYIAMLDRFGYTLAVAGETKEQAEESILKAYEMHYLNINGTSPRNDADDAFQGRTYFDVAKDEVFVEEMKFGETYWW